MKKYRFIFYVVFFLFHLILFGFSLYVDMQKNDFGTLTELYKHVGYIKYGTFLGLVLVLMDFLMDKIEISRMEKKIMESQNETNSWKAKLYDLQNQHTMAETAVSTELDESQPHSSEEEGTTN